VTSNRLTEAIRLYCLQMDDVLMSDLTRAVEEGPLAWFPEEFATAVKNGEFTPTRWEKLTDVLMDEDDDALLDEYLREVWAHAAPGEPYALDA
jgi:hypothetical protein